MKNSRKPAQKRTLKRIIDVCMTVLLLCLMAYQVTGETLHEWFGIGMTVLLIAHHILNFQWYTSLFRGKYNAFRIVTVVVNTLLLLSIGLTALCGMSMSAHAVPFLYGLLPVSFARQLHLAMSHWSFLLMGVHLGLHLPAMTAGIRWRGKNKQILLALFFVVACCGVWLFLKSGMLNYLFFRTAFAMFDHSKAGILVFAENFAMLVSFTFFGALCAVLMKMRRRKKHSNNSRENN